MYVDIMKGGEIVLNLAWNLFIGQFIHLFGGDGMG